MLSYFNRKRFFSAVEATMGIPWNYIGHGTVLIYGMWLAYRATRHRGESAVEWLRRTHTADQLRAMGGARWHMSDEDRELNDELAEELSDTVKGYVQLAAAKAGLQ